MLAFSLISTLMVCAQDIPASINIGASSVVDPSKEAVITIDVNIKAGFDIQGVQVDFVFSDNFPELKNADIIRNTTGWGNAGVSRNNILAVGNVINVNSQLVAKITFDVPNDATPGDEYVLTLENAIAANSSQEFDISLNADSVKITVSGDKPSEDTKEPETNPDGEGNGGDYTQPDGSSPEGNISGDSEKTEENKPQEAKPRKNPFADVKENDWFYDGVRYVFENELMSGVGTGTFAPEATLTRAMLVTILYRLEGSPDALPYGFSDVSRKTWYTKAVDWAASNGIVNGVGGEMFAPELPITREQITVIFYNYSKFKRMDITAREELSAYLDKSKISSL